MYSPKVSEELIPYLYREAKKEKIPMTQLVNKIIKNHLGGKENEIINQRNREEITETLFAGECG